VAVSVVVSISRQEIDDLAISEGVLGMHKEGDVKIKITIVAEVEDLQKVAQDIAEEMSMTCDFLLSTIDLKRIGTTIEELKEG